MSYSQDFREFVAKKVNEGMPPSEAMEFFNISRDSLYRWLRISREGGTLSDPPRKEYKPRKIDSSSLLDKVNAFPDATLEELAQEFSWLQSGCCLEAAQ